MFNALIPQPFSPAFTTTQANFVAPAARVGRFAVLALLGLAVILGGCASSPTTRWAQQREALTSVQDTISDLHESGVVSDRQLLEVHPYLVAARTALADAEAHIGDAGPDFDDALSRARRAIGTARRLIEQRTSDEGPADDDGPDPDTGAG